MPCLCTSPERKSTSKAPKRGPRFRELAAMGRLSTVLEVYHQLQQRGDLEWMRRATRFNSIPRTDRTKTATVHPPSIVPRAPFAPMSAHSSESIFEKPGEEFLMSEIQGAAIAVSAVVQQNRKSTGSHQGLFLSGHGRSLGATARRALLVLIVAFLATSLMPTSAATPDPVLEWIGVMNTTVLPAGTAPNVTSRQVALVSASVFDAVNGIEPRFRPLHVRPDAPRHASQCDAAIQAAYAILLNLYPAQGATLLTPQRNASLAALALTENAESITAGVAWGQTVADAIWASRLTDGFAPTPPPFIGVQGVIGTRAVGA